MSGMRTIPAEFRHGPFSRRSALAAGISARVLEGAQFRRLHKAVYVHRDHEMTWADSVNAARLALPTSARTTGVTRIRELGLVVGSPTPLHFVVGEDLHLTLEGVFLHRTAKMPPGDDVGVSAEAAFVAHCADVRLLEAITVGCVMLNARCLDLDLLDALLAAEKWRRGVAEASYALQFLNDRCRSVPEAKLVTFIMCAGLPIPEVNQQVPLLDDVVLTPDLWFAVYLLAIEYEGTQHQEDRRQYNSDIDRYRDYRRASVAYELVTKERMRSPKDTVRLVHRALVAQGYEGPPPDFDGLWNQLFRPLADIARELRAA